MLSLLSYDYEAKRIQLATDYRLPAYGEKFQHLIIAMDDSKDFPIFKHFSRANSFIENGLKTSNVLIHCYKGVSRSVTIAAAYLMKRQNASFQSVISLLRRKRPKINPNPGFVLQLKAYEESLKASIFSSDRNSSMKSEKSRRDTLDPQFPCLCYRKMKVKYEKQC